MDTDNFHTEMMTRAIEHSKKATQDPSRYEPFGAVIVRNSDRKILGEGCNNMREMMDPSLHGEVVTIRKACQAKGSLELEGCTMYTSCEPCTMCASLIWITKIEKVYYGNSDLKVWELIFDVTQQRKEVATPTRDRCNYEQLMPSEAANVIREWSIKDKNEYHYLKSI